MQNSMTSWSGKTQTELWKGLLYYPWHTFMCLLWSWNEYSHCFKSSFNLIINNQRSLENWFIRSGSELQRFGCFILSIWIKVTSSLSDLQWGVWETFPVYLYSSNVCMWVWLCTYGAAAAASVLRWRVIIHHGWRSGRFHSWFFHVHKSHRHKNDMLLHFCPFAYFVLSD